ncbi:MAG TPA: ROK family protein [Actinophytocola sp.]|uniref:ROK family transcriptional regulator n=1 Tax=Actinophytocola sp. TaxID=1872138 RepID=UPI002E01EF60|nr:ROK family protein [Actinophytocola sp.]
MDQLAGSSRLLRAINETAALGHLLERGPLTRGDLRELTGLAKPTTSDVLRRLQDAGLAKVVGRTSGGPGPNAEVYAVNPDAAYTAALSVRARDLSLATAVCDLAGTVRARREITVDAQPADDPVGAVADAVQAACRHARIPLRRLDHVQIGVPGSYDERADTIHYTDVPGWSRPGLIGEIRRRLRTEVSVDNDANLAAVAERTRGIATDAESFALLWLGEEGLGLAIDLGRTLLRGARGGAGEIGYMPVGLPSTERGRAVVHDFHELVSGTAVLALAREHGISASSGAEAVAAPGAHAEFLAALATRVAVGLAAVIAVLDPPLIVLSGDVGQAAGAPLAEAVMVALRKLSVLQTTVAATGVSDDPVLLGALDTSLSAVRATLLGRR